MLIKVRLLIRSASDSYRILYPYCNEQTTLPIITLFCYNIIRCVPETSSKGRETSDRFYLYHKSLIDIDKIYWIPKNGYKRISQTSTLQARSLYTFSPDPFLIDEKPVSKGECLVQSSEWVHVVELCNKHFIRALLGPSGAMV
jgi:hypothetical protein